MNSSFRLPSASWLVRSVIGLGAIAGVFASDLTHAQYLLTKPLLEFRRAGYDYTCTNSSNYDQLRVAAIALQRNGGVIVGGQFEQVGQWNDSANLPRSGLFRLQADGSLDTSWAPDIRCPGTSATASVRALAVDSKGNIYVGGIFGTSGSEGMRNLARYNQAGELDAAWRVDANDEVMALAVDEEDNLFVGGRFSQIGGADRPYLAKVVDGHVDAVWNPSVAAPILALVIDQGDSIYAGGGGYAALPTSPTSPPPSSSTVLAKLSRKGIGLSDPAWSVDMAPYGVVAALALDHNAHLYAGGQFGTIGGYARTNIARVSTENGKVDPDWMLDHGWNGFPGRGASPLRQAPIAVRSIVVDADGNIFVGGNFIGPAYPSTDPAATPGANARWGVAKINAVGELDTVWGQQYAGHSNGIEAMTLSGEKLYMGGLFDFGNPNGDSFLFGAYPVSAMNLNQQGLSGSWGRSDTPGTRQGFLFNFYPDNVAPGQGTVFAGWYTYDLAGGSGGQRWYALQGDIYSDSTSASLGIYTAVDGNLNSGSKPANTQVGTATLSFSGCSTGSLLYTFNDGRTGSIPLSRVTDGTNCSPSGSSNDPANSLLAGAWGMPNAVGMGFVIDISPSQTTLFGSWYTFFPTGNSASSPRQQWFVFQDNNFSPTATSSSNIDLLQSVGGSFDATFGGGVTTTTVGKVSLNFTSCTTATFTYSIPSQSVSQTTVDLVRLGPAPPGCKL